MFQEIVAGLVARGIPEHIATGIATRMRAESGLNPGINEIKPVVPGSRGGWGLNQWTGPRRTAFERFADARGVKYDDLGAQLDFTKWELDNTESAAWKALQATKTPDEAARVYMEKFLRPGVTHADMRRSPEPPSKMPAAATGVFPQTNTAPLTWGDRAGILGDALMASMPAPAQAPQIMPMQVAPYQPVKRDPLAIYQRLFGSLG